MNLRIEITNEQAICRQDGQTAFAAPLKDFLGALSAPGCSLLPSEATPDGERFRCSYGPVTVLVMEDQPQVRTVRWLADESPMPYGRGATYRTARLAFPFVVVIVVFRAGQLTGYQQCFYRTEPLGASSDALLLPNLHNVAKGYGQQCWLCLANLRRDLAPLTWNDRVREIRNHMWGAAWNRSSEVHELNSYWQSMRTIDPRVQSLDAWEEATRAAPFFPLDVKWRQAGCTVEHVVNAMLHGVGTPRPPATLPELVQLLGKVARPSGGAAVGSDPRRT